MLRVWSVLIAGLLLGMSSTERAGAQGLKHETEDLILQWTESPDSTEIHAVAAEATRAFAQVATILGTEPGRKITIVLGGMAGRDYPRVDSWGRVLLFKFVPDYTNYYGALAHELVHAFRFDRVPTADWFFEEGLAEFVALRADSPLAGFPWFDHPVALVAGQWVAKGEDIPLATLRERHAELNQPCSAQSYALRASFFDWLGRKFGEELVIQAANETPAGGARMYAEQFGEPLEELASAWREELLADYRAIDDADAVAHRYRTVSPIQYQKVCVAGEDF